MTLAGWVWWYTPLIFNPSTGKGGELRELQTCLIYIVRPCLQGEKKGCDEMREKKGEKRRMQNTKSKVRDRKNPKEHSSKKSNKEGVTDAKSSLLST